MADVALSLKQPWATLLVHGIKTIEIRRWPTSRRGRVLIHAARRADTSERGWSLVPAELRGSAELTGGIVGAGELADCITYESAESFAADEERHRNDPAWYRGPLLYGFRFDRLTALPFREYPGWVRFFPVNDAAPRRSRNAKR